MKRFIYTTSLLSALLSLSGCNLIGAKTGSLSIVYGVMLIFSLVLLIGYCLFVQQKEIWFLLLFASIFIVNTGYFALSISKSIEEALLANRISYLGSVFLPMSMLMIILNTTRINYKKWLPMLLFIICIFVFLVAASPGYLDIYYKEVSLRTVNGVTMLHKVYGPWHSLYLYYLLSYFSSMIGFIAYAILRKESTPCIHAIMLAGAVFVNIVVWLIEQIVHIDFELLSVSYIICELFLLGLHIIMLENERLKNLIPTHSMTEHEQTANHTEDTKHSTVTDDNKLISEPTSEISNDEIPEKFSEKLPDTTSDKESVSEEQEQLISFYQNGLNNLTKTETVIFNYYLSGRTTKEIMSELNITENTLKFHNKNIYSKLGVSSRKQMLAMHKQLV